MDHEEWIEISVRKLGMGEQATVPDGIAIMSNAIYVNKSDISVLKKKTDKYGKDIAVIKQKLLISYAIIIFLLMFILWR